MAAMAIVLGRLLLPGAPAAAQAAGEPLTKTCRVTRPDDGELQKIAPFNVFDNLYIAENRGRRIHKFRLAAR